MRAGQAEIQTKLFFDYRATIESYPEWQRWMPDTQPLLLVLRSRHDLSFDLSEAEVLVILIRSVDTLVQGHQLVTAGWVAGHVGLS
jgi:hypothetical protein